MPASKLPEVEDSCSRGEGCHVLDPPPEGWVSHDLRDHEKSEYICTTRSVAPREVRLKEYGKSSIVPSKGPRSYEFKDSVRCSNSLAFDVGKKMRSVVKDRHKETKGRYNIGKALMT